MTVKQARQMVRTMVVEACESRGASLYSRQVEAVTEVMTDIFIRMAETLQEVSDRLAVLEEANGN